MKILKITTFYPEYLKYIYTKRQSLKNSSYIEQLQYLNYDAFGWADFWSNALKSSEFEMLEVTANNEYLQKAWLRDQAGKNAKKNWYYEVLIEQVKSFNPDLLFFEDRSIAKELIQQLKLNSKSLRATIAWCGTPYTNISEFSEFDHVIGCVPELNATLAQGGLNVFNLSHAFDERILNRLAKNLSKKHNLSFVGQVLKDAGMHSNRYEYIRKLCEETDISIYSPSLKNSWFDMTKRIAYQVVGAVLQLLSTNTQVSKIIKGNHAFKGFSNYAIETARIASKILDKTEAPIYGLEMFQLLKESKVCFNIHIEASKNSASNMRLYEVTGVGSCLLTDHKENLIDYFKPYREVMPYYSPEDCIEKAVWLNANPEKREKIAKNGQVRTIRDHTFQNRSQDLIKILKKIAK
jgi:spore maturation protein CgeB